jgi:hypothetical protein
MENLDQRDYEEKVVEKFIGLIKWASKQHRKKYYYLRWDYQDYFSKGLLVLTVCLKKWNNRGDDEEFGKFFKTSLFFGFQDMVRAGFLDKGGVFLSANKEEEITDLPYGFKDIEEYEGFRYMSVVPPRKKESKVYKNLAINGFEDQEYKEAVKHFASLFKSEIEKKIFLLIVDPPEDLCRMAVLENRRRTKGSFHTGKPSWGKNKVRVSSNLVIAYLNKNGDSISDNDYYIHYKKIRDVVRKEIGAKNERKREVQSFPDIRC